jgi:hypothetical protein
MGICPSKIYCYKGKINTSSQDNYKLGREILNLGKLAHNFGNQDDILDNLHPHKDEAGKA